MKNIKKFIYLFAVVMLTGLIAIPAKAQNFVLDTRFGSAQNNCKVTMDVNFPYAKALRDNLTTIPGSVESAANTALYDTALVAYTRFLKSKDTESAANLNDCQAAFDGFKKYFTSMRTENAVAYRDYAAARIAAARAAQALTPEYIKIKSELDACVVKIKALKVSNDAMLAESQKFEDWNLKTAVSNTWDKVDKYLLAFLGTNSTTYTASNVKFCQDWTANTDVKTAFDLAKGKVTGKQACLVDLRALRISNTALKEDAEKNLDDQKKSVIDAWTAVETLLVPFLDKPPVVPSADDLKNCQAVAVNTSVKKAYDDGKKVLTDRATKAAELAAKAAEASKKVDAINAANKELADCKEDWHKRLLGAASRFDTLMKKAAVSNEEVGIFNNTYHKQSSDEYKQIITTPITLAQCKVASNNFDTMDRYVASLESRYQAKLAKEAAEEQVLEEKRKANYAKWLEAHPKDIPGACRQSCMIRHNGEGPKEKECERMCAVSVNAVASALNTAVDEAFMKPLDAALDKLGVSKALCEAAQSQVAQIIQKANSLIDQKSDQVKEKSESACTGTAEKCGYVKRFIQTALDAKACSNVAKTLTKSHDTAQTKYNNQKTAIKEQKDRMAKKDQSKDNAFKDAAKDTMTESAETCESPKASDLIANLIKPCLAASANAEWLVLHAKDYK